MFININKKWYENFGVIKSLLINKSIWIKRNIQIQIAENYSMLSRVIASQNKQIFAVCFVLILWCINLFKNFR